MALRGRERELASLLVLLRLWRLIKLVGGECLTVVSSPMFLNADSLGVAAGFEEQNEETLKLLRKVEAQLRKTQEELSSTAEELRLARCQITDLQSKLDAHEA